MTKLNKNSFGLIIGCFFAFVHAVWALTIAIAPKALQNFLNWIFSVHFLEPVYTLTAFSLSKMLFLVAITFVFGYLFGWVLAWIWNSIMKK